MLSSAHFVLGLCVDLCQSLHLIATVGSGLALYRLIRRMSFESSAGSRGRQAWPCVFCRGCAQLVLPDAGDFGGERGARRLTECRFSGGSGGVCAGA